MKIIIETIPHKRQRYETAGDWYYTGMGKKLVLHIKVSETRNPLSSELVAVHELIEVLLCRQARVTRKQVDDFDFKFKPTEVNDEPGDDPKSPYQRQHCFATAVERMMCAEFGLTWGAYADDIEAL